MPFENPVGFRRIDGQFKRCGGQQHVQIPAALAFQEHRVRELGLSVAFVHDAAEGDDIAQFQRGHVLVLHAQIDFAADIDKETVGAEGVAIGLGGKVLDHHPEQIMPGGGPPAKKLVHGAADDHGFAHEGGAVPQAVVGVRHPALDGADGQAVRIRTGGKQRGQQTCRGPEGDMYFHGEIQVEARSLMPTGSRRVNLGTSSPLIILSSNSAAWKPISRPGIMTLLRGGVQDSQ